MKTFWRHRYCFVLFNSLLSWRRKSDKTVTKEDIKTACPFCDYDTEEYKLTCSSCKNLIPYCIITVNKISIQILIKKTLACRFDFLAFSTREIQHFFWFFYSLLFHCLIKWYIVYILKFMTIKYFAGSTYSKWRFRSLSFLQFSRIFFWIYKVNFSLIKYPKEYVQ